MSRRLTLALAPALSVAGVLALATFAHAQPPGPPPGGGPVMRMMHGGPGGPDMKAMHEAMMKQHLEDMKTILRLRPDQEPALQALVAAMHPPGMKMEMGHDGPPPGPKTLPERLADEARHDAAGAAERQKVRDALTKFYAALSSDQQKVFDALQRLQAGPMGHGGPGMRMGGPMMMGMGGGGMRHIEIRRIEAGPPAEHDHD